MGELRKLRPDVPSFGYATVLSINATSVWGGVFPYLPAACQTELVTIGFYICQLLAFSLSFAGWMALAWARPGVARSRGVLPFAVPLCAGPLCMVSAMYLSAAALPLIVLAALLIGFGLAGFMVSWQRVFAALGSTEGNLALIKGTAGSAGLYLLICLVPPALTAYLLPLIIVPLAGLCLWMALHALDEGQPMFEDSPRDHAAVYRNALRESVPPALGVGALGFVAGAIRFIAITHQGLLSAINILSMVALFAVVAVFYGLWRRRTLRVSLGAVFRVLFPLVAVCLVVMPFVGEAFTNLGFGLANGCFMLSCLFMMMHCGQLSRDSGINPILIYGFYGTLAYSPQILGYLVGYASGIESQWGVGQFSFVSLASLFALLLAALFGLHGIAGRSRRDAGDLELLTLAGHAGPAPAAVGPAAGTPASPPAPDEAPPDALAWRCAQVGRDYGLSTREVEVMELIARGHTGPAIAERLFISENTMRTHNKRIYAKLDVHKKQELLQLIESYV
ncbi:MAG: helix-turn-helix transcriptional regulator [Eggerthellaceae bacterium]|nr:helix-turn-helix transcriptional regulator [Eggerthellaceae bacterium]